MGNKFDVYFNNTLYKKGMGFEEMNEVVKQQSKHYSHIQAVDGEGKLALLIEEGRLVFPNKDSVRGYSHTVEKNV